MFILCDRYLQQSMEIQGNMASKFENILKHIIRCTYIEKKQSKENNNNPEKWQVIPFKGFLPYY